MLSSTRQMRLKAELDETVFVGDLRVLIHWNAWELGMSVFIPCIDPTPIRRQMSRKAQKYGYTLESSEGVEDQQFGVRFWRTA